MHEITLELEGKTYTASYQIFGDTQTTYLPDGTTRTTELRGLIPELSAETHLRGYALDKLKKEKKT